MSTSLQDVAGIGPHAAGLLSEHGINSAEELASASVEAVGKVPGFAGVRAQRSIAAAQARC